MERVLVSGGTGFIGRKLVAELLGRGRKVAIMTRNPATVSALWPEVEPVSWDDREGLAKVLLECRGVIHLAGTPAFGRRWSPQVKAEIKRSRVGTTRALVAGIEQIGKRPEVLVSVSAVGYYGAHPSHEWLTEADPPGEGFLSEVTREWESTAQAAEPYGVRVVTARLGVVLGDGGALAEMVKPFRWGVGGPIGSGEQVVSWVHVDDAVAMLLLVLDDPSFRGPVNLTAPNPVTQRQLSKAIGVALGKPAWLPVPEAALRIRFGEGAEPLITGQRVRPQVMLDHGYRWRYPEVGPAVAAALSGS